MLTQNDTHARRKTIVKINRDDVFKMTEQTATEHYDDKINKSIDQSINLDTRNRNESSIDQSKPVYNNGLVQYILEGNIRLYIKILKDFLEPV
jgi:hypothetical protein